MTQPNRWAGLVLAVALLTGCAGAAPQTADNSAATPGAGTAPGSTTEATTDTVDVPVATDTMTTTEAPPLEAPKLSAKAVTTDSGLQYEDTLLGEGEEAQTGDLVTVHYTGYLEDGTVFDTSIPMDQPIEFSLGAGRVIVGWDEGVAGMKVGGKRVLVIPPDLAYGAEENGPIPANSTLVFEVELTEVAEQPKPASVDEYTTTDTGLEYAILVEGEGAEAKTDDVVEFNFRAWREDGIMFDSSEQAGRTAQFPLGQSGLTGLDQGIEGMKEGETRQLRIPPDLAYGEEGAGDVIPPNATIIFEIELVKIVPPPEQAEVDEGDYTTTESGLQYVILAEGEGEATAAEGDTVAMHYSGWLEDGTLFDSSLQRGEPFTFTLGQGGVIAGWDEGIVGMKVGEKRQFRIPGDLAYGEAGRGSIPPNATLIFDVELVEIMAQ